MKDRIIEFLDTKKKPLSETVIFEMLELRGTEELTELCSVLRDLEVDAKVYRTNSGEYTLYKYTHLKVGKIAVNKKGFGFLLLENEPDIYVSKDNLNGAIHNDLVVVDRINKEEGKVIKIVNRTINDVVGELKLGESGYYIKIDSDKVRLNLEISDENRFNAMPGHIVLATPFNQIKGNIYEGRVVRILGHKDDPGVDILSIVYEFDIKDQFDKEVMEEIENISDVVLKEELVGRRDLRNEEIFTIDGDDAKDFDDAVCVRKLENNNYLLGVHIADVTNYVKENTALNEEAMYRGTSVYLVDRVIPMLPHKLSNGICSLNPNVDRLTLSCDMEIDPFGKVVKYDIYNSVIRSKMRMTYKNVNKILEKNEDVIGYEPFKKSLLLMKELADILRKEKLERGYIDFDIDEPKIIADESGKPIEITVRERGIGEKLIEDFMIVANETVAEYVYWLEYPFVYRVHDKPKEEKVRNFLNLLNNLGYRVKGKIKNITPKFMQGIIDMVKDTNDFSVISELGLRTMKKAVYSVDNIGHFGLASRAYTHFTSPIRRYPDLTVHRLLKNYIAGYVNHNIKENLVFTAEHSSSKEKDSVDCEREVENMKMAEYMEGQINKEFKGKISGVIPSGMFVRLDNLIEGMVHVSTLPGYFIFNEEAQMFINKKGNKRFRLGDEVKIKVIRASKEERTIDFEII